MKSTRIRLFVSICWLVPCLKLTAQSQTSSHADPSASEEKVLTLNPFQVSANADDGYATTETLDGTRFKSNMKDVSANVSIMTPDFLQDIAAVTVDEAFLYSANIENLTEFTQASDGDFAAGILNQSGGRIRGLGDAGRSRDFFRTTIPGDSYNTDRISISSGPNAILFGNSNPGGVVNTGYSRADLARTRYEVSVRADNYGSLRGTIDVNQPIIEDKLGVRLAALSSNQKYWWEPGYKNEDRLYAAISFKPFEGTTLRAYYEDMEWDSIPVRNTRAGDRVTPWIEAGMPLVDNRINPNAPTSTTAGQRNTALNAAYPGVFQSNPNNLIVRLENGAAGSPGFFNAQNQMVRTLGPNNGQLSPDDYTYSLPDDDSVFPRDVNINGNGTRNRAWGKVHGLALEQRLPGGGFFEGTYNRESFEMWASDFTRGFAFVEADANMYLPDGSANPNAGRLYVENGRPRIIARMSEFEEARAQVSYDFDLTDRSGWARWLGRHRMAGMFQRSEFVGNVQQSYDPRLAPAGMTAEQVRQNLNNTAALGGNTVRFPHVRTYLDGPLNAVGNGAYTYSLSFNPLDTPVLDWGDGRTYYGGPDSPAGGISQPTIVNDRIDSWVFGLQSFLLKDRIVLNYGYRNDTASQATYQVQPLDGSGSGFESLLGVAIPSDFGEETSGSTSTKGAVVHLFPWLSAFYNESTTWNQPTQWINPDDGSSINGSVGEGEDYGVMMRFFDNRISLRVNRYTNTNGPTSDVTYRNSIVSAVDLIEDILIDNAEAGNISPVTPPTYFDPNQATVFQRSNLVSQLESTGTEFSLTYNPTRNWRMTLNGGKSDSVASDIGRAWIRYIEERAPIWEPHAALLDLSSNNSTTTVGSTYLGILQTLNQMAQADGQRVEQGREWRVNFVTRYNFTEGRLKGLHVGGGYRWRSKNVLGYRLELVDNAFPFAGAPTQLEVPALDSPIYGDALVNVDAFVGYSRKLGEKVRWKIQLNVRNLFDDRDPVYQRANLHDGFVTRYAVPEPRSFILTNTFTF